MESEVAIEMTCVSGTLILTVNVGRDPQRKTAEGRKEEVKVIEPLTSTALCKMLIVFSKSLSKVFVLFCLQVSSRRG